MNDVLRGDEDTEVYEGRGNGTMEEEIGVIQPQAQGHLEAPRSWKRQEQPSPGAIRGSTGLRCLDLRFLASRTGGG